jgi:general secretion pathway protein D
MKIDQTISNTVPGSAGAGGNPDIFKRSISTEVVAESSQMVVLGGLISENFSTGLAGVPGLSKIPFLGGLFKSDSNNSDRTELVMLITPRVLSELSEWDLIRQAFGERLKYLNMGE